MGGYRSKAKTGWCCYEFLFAFNTTHINRKLNNDKETIESEWTSKRTLKPAKRLIRCIFWLFSKRLEEGRSQAWYFASVNGKYSIWNPLRRRDWVFVLLHSFFWKYACGFLCKSEFHFFSCVVINEIWMEWIKLKDFQFLLWIKDAFGLNTFIS